MKYSFKNKIKIINMGGEQFAILIYGPKINLSYDEWVNKFNLINKKEWVRNFVSKGFYDYEGSFDTFNEDDIDIVFSEEFHEAPDLLYDFLKEHSLITSFNSNLNWEEPFIGMEVKDYDLFSEEQKQKVKEFCGKYDLPKPTFYACIIGEFS
jgi:hypothetical protein